MSSSRWISRRFTAVLAGLAMAVPGSLLLGPAAGAASPATLSGTVTDATNQGHPAVPGVNVTIENPSTGAVVTTTATQSDGTWSAAVDPGSYAVYFSLDQFIPEYWAEGGSATTLASASVVPATAGQTTGSLNAALTEGLQLSGTVTEQATGVPVSGVHVKILHYSSSSTAGGGWSEVTYLGAGTAPVTANDGTWLADVSRGSYVAEFLPKAYAQQFWLSSNPEGVQTPNAATPISSNTTNINPQLVVGTSVSGTITDSSGANAISGATVNILAVSKNASTGTSDATPVATATTNPNGTWQANNVAPGSYDVQATAGGYATTYYKHSATLSGATPVSVTSGTPVTGIGISMFPSGGVLSGTVSQSNGLAPSGTVSAFQYVTTNTNGITHTRYVNVGNTATDQFGNYSFSLPTGTYRLEYLPDNGAPTFYPSATGLDSAQDVSVSGAGPTHANIAIPQPGTISGQITYDGAPQVQASVTACAQYVDNVVDGVAHSSCQWVTFPNNVTGAGGTYSIAATPGSWFVEGTSADGTLSAFHVASGYPASDDFSQAAPVAVQSSQTTSGVNIELHVLNTNQLTTVTNTVVPSISGTAAVGSVLTADPGIWLPSGASYSYQWFDNTTSNGTVTTTPISGATHSTYTIASSDATKTISVQVVASEGDLNAGVASSQPTGTIPTPPLLGLFPPPYVSTPTNSVKPSISGTPAAGQPLTASAGTWSGSDTVAYQWYATQGANTVVIPWANQETYVPTPDLVGYTITVKVWNSFQGLTGSATSAASAAVLGAPVQNISAPTISGDPVVGATLSASSGAWSPSPGSISYTYQWKAGGTAIAGANGQTYSPVSADVGKPITVTVTAVVPNYQNGVATSAPTNTVLAKHGPVQNLVAPQIDGTPVVGNTLTATQGTWNPANVTVSYQWNAAGKAIPGAVNATFQPGAAQIGVPLTVTVVAAAPYYANGTATSTATSPVAANNGPVQNLVAPQITGTPALGATLTASQGTWNPANVTVSYQWNAAGQAIPGATGATFQPGPAQVGKSLTVVDTAAAPSYANGVATSAATAAVAPGHLRGTGWRVAGTAKVGHTLRAVHGTWSPAGVTFRYQWFVGGRAVRGSTGQTFRVPASARGKRVVVYITVSKPGYTTVTRAAAAR